MKIRNGFVSNSSSSSFVIRKENLNNAQIEMIKNHGEMSRLLHKIGWKRIDSENNYSYGDDDGLISKCSEDGYDEWSVSDEGDTLLCSTSMDNWDLEGFCLSIGVKKEDIRN